MTEQTKTPIGDEQKTIPVREPDQPETDTAAAEFVTYRTARFLGEGNR